MQEHYNVRRCVGTHPAADDGFAPGVPLLPAPSERDGDHRAVRATPNRRPVILASASVTKTASARMDAVETGEGAAAFPLAVTVARGGRP